jgi:glucose/arabinose dehydrogenase
MRIGPQRPVNPDAIVAPPGYRVEALVTGLTFPSAISFGPGGELYLAESGGVASSVVAVPRVLRIDPDRSVNEIGRLENPIVGLVYRNGELLIGEDGPSPRILRVTAEGELQILVDNLPGGGDYGLSGLSLDSSGALLFGLGTRTNSGVVGLDNVARGWVARNPESADVPGVDVQQAGVNYVTSQPALRGTARSTTGSYKPFGVRCDRDDLVRGANRCGGAIYRLAADGGGDAERLAWGLRNPVGVACSPDGRIFATEGGMEERGSRPIAAAPDNLWEIRPGSYYGWPDYASGISVTDARFRLPGHPQPRRLLENAPKVVATPAATFAARSGVGRVDFSTSDAFGFVGDALVALSGAWSNAAFVGEDVAPGGYRVVRVDPRSGAISDFLVNRQSAPSSAGNTGGLERPFDVRFDPSGEVLYVVDLGEVQLSREYGLEPFGGTGVVWRITRIRPMVQVSGGRDRAQQAAAQEAESTDTDFDTDDTSEEIDETEELTGAGEGETETADSEFFQSDLGGFDAAGAEASDDETPAETEEAEEPATEDAESTDEPEAEAASEADADTEAEPSVEPEAPEAEAEAEAAPVTDFDEATAPEPALFDEEVAEEAAPEAEAPADEEATVPEAEEATEEPAVEEETPDAAPEAADEAETVEPAEATEAADTTEEAPAEEAPEVAEEPTEEAPEASEAEAEPAEEAPEAETEATEAAPADEPEAAETDLPPAPEPGAEVTEREASE